MMPTDAITDLVARHEPSFTARVGMPDGVELATDVYLPAARALRGHPVALIRTPYGRRGEIDAVPETAALLTDAGIAVVAQDVRGKFDSGGERDPFVHEVVDGHATVEWIAGQPWSHGAVVPLGASYTGFTAWAAAASRHPALRGAVVRMTTCHIADEWLYRQGLFRLQMNGPWALFAWGQRDLVPFEPDWAVRPLSALPPAGADDRHLRRWLHAPPDAAAPLSRGVQVPVLHSGGWWDLLARGQIREWNLLSGSAGQRLVMGATDHDFHRFADVADGAAAHLPPRLRRTPVDDDFQPALDFLLAVSRGDPPASGVRWELTHDGWHDGAHWPPPGRHDVRLYLADGAHAAYGPEGGALAHRPDSVPLTVGWTHDPADLVPSLETFVWGTLAHDYPDERDAQVRDDVLTFSGPPAVEPLDVVGPLSLRLRAQATARRAQLAVTVCDVQPDGRALRIAEGGCLLEGAGDWREVDVDLGPLAYRLRPDHRLRVAIAASSFPRYLWPPGDGLDAWTDGPGPPSEQRVRLGDASYLELGVLD